MYTIKLQEGSAYFDPATGIHLKLGNKTKKIDEEFDRQHDMSNIEYAVKLGTLSKTEYTETKDDTETQTEIKEDTEDIEEDTEEEDTEEETEENRCQAITSSGQQCKNNALYPEEDPQYCGVHKNKLEEE